MINQENDTVIVNGEDNVQNTVQNIARKPCAGKKGSNAMLAKMLAVGSAGMVAGGASLYAAEKLVDHFNSKPEEAEEVEQNAEEQQAETEAAEQRQAEIDEQERVRQHNEEQRQHNEQVRQQQEAQRQEQQVQQQQQQQEQPKVKPVSNEHEEPTFLKEHDVRIESIEEHTTESGEIVQVAYGTVDSHDAMFVSDQGGRVIAAAIDVNDDGNLNEGELFDASDSNITMRDLAVHQASVPVHDDPQVEVIAVEHDVEMDGGLVDVAAVSIDNEQLMLVDTDQNGEVNLMIADENHNGSISEDEIHDVSASHIPMPTEDDINDAVQMVSIDDPENDYTNDADVQMYEA